MSELPSWGKTGDWDENKRQHEQREYSFQQELELTAAAWSELYRLSVAYNKARRRFNDWESSFVWSIAEQLGFHDLLEGDQLFETYEEAREKWDHNSSSWTFLYRGRSGAIAPRKIETLSPKQLALLHKIESK